MANERHLAAVKLGADHWNRWRTDHTAVIPDLSEADLTGASLPGADFHGANLSHAKLSGAKLHHARFDTATAVGINLSAADLRASNLTGANFCGADLSSAALTGVTLRHTQLVSAKLRLAQLYWAVFDDALLTDADFSQSSMLSTTLAKLDLSAVQGLETVFHGGPSTIGLDTIYRSQGKIPQTFLRGAGAPENFIEYMHSLTGHGFQYYSCFISHSSKDQEFAERLHADLQSRGVRCWFAPEDLKIGDKLRPAFDEAIRVHDKLMVVLSEQSVKSPWVEKEVETAFEKEQTQKRTVLFPIRLDNTVMETQEAWAADIRRTRHIGDFRNWRNHGSYKKAFARLLRDLKTETKAEI